MQEISKLLIAYDGSACSEAALSDLSHAGLPTSVEALVITVADIILPPPDEALPLGDRPGIRIPEVERHAQTRAEKFIEEAKTFAEHAVKRIKAEFPAWNVIEEVVCDSPAWGVLKIADKFNPDLIVVGSHEHSLLGGRLILGSVSQKVLYEAQCSVRLARCSESRAKGPVRIVLGIAGSLDSEVAVEAVASRLWPEGTQVRIITAHDTSASAIHSIAVDKLRAAGLATSDISKDGDPAYILVKEAETWGADCIFVGATDVHGFRHLLHGSISSAVAARAQCSVEVSRAARGAELKEVQGATNIHVR